MKKKLIKNFLLFLVLLIVISVPILTRELDDLDELWNYNFARNILEGKLPYKDFNMVLTPLLPIICSFFLKVFGNQLIVMRIIAIILNTTILFMFYKILELLRVNKYISYLSLSGIYYIYYNYFCADYNFTVLLIALTTIWLELKNINNESVLLKHNFKHDFLVGLLVGSSVLVKQNTGLFLTAIYIFYKLLIVSKKEDWKIVAKIIFYRTIGALIPAILLLIYLLINHIFMDFLDYTILGIKTFSNKVSYTYLFKTKAIYIRILSVIIPVTIIYMYYKSVILTQKTIEQKRIFILFVYSVASFLVVYPISDEIHFLIGSMPTIISLIYIIWLTLKNRKIKKSSKVLFFIKQILKYTSLFLMIIIVIRSCVLLSKHVKNYTKFSKLNHFKYIISNIDENINEINYYMNMERKNGQKVYILDATACVYMIPQDLYNKNYDMFLKGNLGLKGEDAQIESLENEKNIVVLIMNEKYIRNWQNPEKVRQHIINNWNKIGAIENFDIYSKQ